MSQYLFLPGGGQAPGQRQVVYGQVSTLQPAPSSFTDPLFIVLPDFSVDHAFKVTNWPAIHGAKLPALGADCLVVIDDHHVKRVAWWDGGYVAGSATPSGAAGGVLSGTYPNPGMAAGAAATNVGTLGGDLSGSLPNPTVAKVNGTTVPLAAAWTTVTLLNSWTNVVGTAAFMKDPLGYVHVRGRVGSGLTNTVAFVLPVGSRPGNLGAFQTTYPGAAVNTATPVASLISIDGSNGNVTLFFGSAITDFGVGGINFLAEN